jgi:hypothetical protein
MSTVKALICATKTTAILIVNIFTLAFAEERKASDTYIQDNQPEQIAYPIEGVVLGQGWNFITGRRAQAICVEGGTVTDLLGSSATTQYQYLFDREQLYNSMGLSASASYGGFGWSASVKTSFSETALSDRSRTRILSTTLVDKGGSQLSPEANQPEGIRLSKSAMQLAKDKREFQKRCGDGFVIAIRKGGQLDVIYELATSLTDYSSAFNLSMSASGYGASANMALDKKRKDTLNDEQTNIRLAQSGGILSTPLSADSIKSKIENFPGFETTTAAPYRVVVWPYNLLSNSNIAPRGSVLNTRSAFFVYQRLMDLTAMYEDAQMRPEGYYFPFFSEGIKSDGLAKTSKILRASTRCLEGLISSCIKDGACEIAPENTCNLLKDDQELTPRDKFLSYSLVFGGQTSVDLFNKDPQQVKNIFPDSADKKDLLSELASEVSTAEKSKKIDRYDLYYNILAIAPIKRSELVVSGTKVALSKTNDEAFQAYQLCQGSSFNHTCNISETDYYNALFITPGPDEKTKQAKQLLIDWVRAIRLLPLSQNFCAQSLGHPMCKNPEQIEDYLPKAELIKTGADANFIKQEIRDNTPAPPPKKKEPYFPRDFCERRPVRCPI